MAQRAIVSRSGIDVQRPSERGCWPEARAVSADSYREPMRHNLGRALGLHRANPASSSLQRSARPNLKRGAIRQPTKHCIGTPIDDPQNAFFVPTDDLAIHLSRNGSFSRVDRSVRQIDAERRRCLLTANRALKHEHVGICVGSNQHHPGAEHSRSSDAPGPCSHQLPHLQRGKRRGVQATTHGPQITVEKPCYRSFSSNAASFSGRA